MGEPTSTRPAPTANGALAKTPLLHLLVYAFDKKLTGTIELVAPDRRSAAILFAGGQPAKVRTSEPVAYLGSVLHELGALPEEALNESLAELAKAKSAGPMLHGTLLLARGLVDAAKLRSGLREQLARKLRHIAAMPAETVYAYYDAFDALRGWGGEGEGVDPVPLLWGMLLAYPPWDRVTSALTTVSASALRLAGTADLERLGLGPDERAAAELLRLRPMRVTELPKVGQLNDRTARLLAYLLLVTKQVDVLPPSEVSPTPLVKQAASRASVPPTSSQPVLPPVSVSPPRSVSPLPAMTPPRSVTPSPRLPAALTPPRTASSPSFQSVRSTSPAPSVLAPPAGASPSVAPAKRNSPPPAPEPPPTLAPELAARWREITDRAATIDRADYFMMLDLSRDATHEDVETAFIGLVKRWHPDRLASELAVVRDACSRVFSRMSEAHATLTDDARRAQYMRLLADGSGSPETQATLAKVVEAATNFQKAEVCFRRNDFTQAEAFCRKALDDDPTQPDYFAMFAWLVSLKPENQSPEKTVASIQMLDRAISISDRCEKAYFWRGLLLKRLAKNDAAVRDFRRAAELNPRNIDAVREVRLYHMRGGRRSSNPPATKRASPSPPRPDETSKPGLLGRFFKKT